MEPVNFQNLTPYYPPLPREETTTPQPVAEIVEPIPKNPQADDSFQKAAQDLSTMQKGIWIPFLSMLNVQFVTLSQLLKTMGTDRGLISIKVIEIAGKTSVKAILDDFSLQLFLLFAELRRYKVLLDGQMSPDEAPERLIAANIRLKSALKLYEVIRSTCVTQYGDDSKCSQLKQHLNILSHLCNQPQFLEENLNPLSNEPIISLRTGRYFDFYLNGLDAALRTLLIYPVAISETYELPIKEALEGLKRSNLSKNPEFIKLEPLLHRYITLLKSPASLQTLKGIIVEAKSSKDNITLKALFESLHTNFSTAIYKEMYQLLGKQMIPWGFDIDESNQLVKEVDGLCSSIKKLLGKIKSSDKKTRLPLAMIHKCINCDDYKKYCNALLIDPSRMPKYTGFSICKFLESMEQLQSKYDIFLEKLLQNNLQFPPCTAFNALDLLFYNVSKILQKKMVREIPNLSRNILNLFEEIIKTLFTLENETVVTKQNNNRITIIRNLQEHLIQLCDALSVLVNESPMLEMLKSLKEFLEAPNISSDPIHYIFLYEPLNKQETIETKHSPLIQDFYKTTLLTLKSFSFDCFTIIDNELKKNLVALPKERFFWQLSRKCAKLLQFELIASLQSFEKYAIDIRKSTTPAELYVPLNCWKNERLKLVNRTLGDKQRDTLNILGILAKKMNLKTIHNAINDISRLHSFHEFFSRTMYEITQLDFEASNKPIKTIAATEPSKGDEDTNKEVEFLEIPSIPEIAQYTDSHYASKVHLIDQLKLLKPSPLSPEEPPENSYCFRVIKRKEALDNLSFRLTLIEENQVSSLLQARDQLDLLLLLEATEQVALCSLRLGVKETPNQHIASLHFDNRPLLYLHDGEKFRDYIAASHLHWFETIREVIPHQKNQMTKVFWFQEEAQEVPGIQAVKGTCEKIWCNLSNFPASKDPISFQAEGYSETIYQLNKFKRKQFLQKLPPFEKPRASFQGFNPAINRVCAFYEQLDHLKLAPLSRCTRFAEIQVSILSLSMQTVLAQFPDENEQNRPLIHIHRMDKLLPLLKDKIPPETFKLLEDYLPLFVGDPRYPYPNKTPLTQTLVEMHKRTHLLLRFQDGGFFTKREQKTLQRIIGDAKNQPLTAQEEVLKESNAKFMEQQKEKTQFAFYLAGLLLYQK